MMRDAQPASEELAPRVDLTFATDLPVLGIVTRFETNSRDVHALVREAFGAWELLHRDAWDSAEPTAHVRVVVRDGSEGTAGRSVIHHRFLDELRLVARSAGSIGISDPYRAEAIAHVTSELVAACPAVVVRPAFPARGRRGARKSDHPAFGREWNGEEHARVPRASVRSRGDE
jgi:hypothetical protein